MLQGVEACPDPVGRADLGVGAFHVVPHVFSLSTSLAAISRLFSPRATRPSRRGFAVMVSTISRGVVCVMTQLSSRVGGARLRHPPQVRGPRWSANAWIRWLPASVT